MGSVGERYRCQLCGRVGNGGYHADGVRFLHCTGRGDANYACMFRRDGLLSELIVASALRAMSGGHPILGDNGISVAIASFLR